MTRTSPRERINAALSERGPSTTDDLIARTGMSAPAVSVYLRALMAEEVVLMVTARPDGPQGRLRRVYMLPQHLWLPNTPMTEAPRDRDRRYLDNAERDQRMLTMYRDGAVLEAIGEAEGVTRERVRQILSHYPEYKRIQQARKEARRQRREAAKAAAHPQFDLTCPVCGTEFRGGNLRIYCKPEHQVIAVRLRYITSVDAWNRHRKSMAKAYLRDQTPGLEGWAQKVMADEELDARRWLVTGSFVHRLAATAMKEGWPIFDAIIPEIQAWLRDHPNPD